MNKVTVSTDNAPKAIGPYEQGIKVGDFVFASGQIPLDPKTGNLIAGGITEQTRQVMENLRAILETGGRPLTVVHGVFEKHRRLRGDERGLRRLLGTGETSALDGCRGRSAARRAGGDRFYRHGLKDIDRQSQRLINDDHRSNS
jgi:hypothetical protein